MVDETNREDAVKALVYEATARMRDPVYGCTGAIYHMQKMVEELRSQLESVRGQVLELKAHRDQLLGILMNVGCLDIVSTMHEDPIYCLDDPLLQHHNTQLPYEYDPLFKFPLDNDD